jgi:cell division protein FtsW
VGLQVFVHIAALTGLIPLTGVPLPFISYGGTALIVFLTMAGVITNISKYS